MKINEYYTSNNNTKIKILKISTRWIESLYITKEVNKIAYISILSFDKIYKKIYFLRDKLKLF